MKTAVEVAFINMLLLNEDAEKPYVHDTVPVAATILWTRNVVDEVALPTLYNIVSLLARASPLLVPEVVVNV